MEGINRRGLITALAAPVLEAAREIPGDFVLDGEDMGETFVAFDLLRSDGADVCPQPYSYRLAVLEALVPESGAGPLRRTETVVERSAKEALFQMLRDGQAEGAVFKRLSAPYKPGRDGHNDQFKFKFVATASFVTGPMNRAKRSVALRLYRGRRLVSAGNVTIPVNFPIPKPGTVIEVKYLYAFPESGSVYQPVYLGRRDDIPPEDCTIDQLKFKQGAEEVPA